jgi:succinate dehydrogenase / fumarate reductase cytochrome b subunit
MNRDRAYFILRKLHSLTGIIPVGTFLVAHLAINSGALLGECAFTDGVRLVNSLPFLPYIEIFGILLPISFHAVLGLGMIFLQARYNNMAYNYSRNWWYLAQRVTGVLIVAFLAWHLWDLWIAKELGHLVLGDFYGHLGTGMSTSQLYLAAMVVGSLAATFHLVNGAWGFSASWGILQSRRAQRVGGWTFGLVGIVIALAWLNIVVHFATGGSNAIPVQDPPFECTTAQLQELED